MEDKQNYSIVVIIPFLMSFNEKYVNYFKLLFLEHFYKLSILADYQLKNINIIYNFYKQVFQKAILLLYCNITTV